MRIYSLLFVLLLMPNVFGSTLADSKVSRNKISICISNVNLFDHYKAAWSTNSIKYYGPLSSVALSYERSFRKHFFFEVSAMPFLRNNYSPSQKGDVLSKEMGVVNLRIGKVQKVSKNVNIGLGVDALYRFGGGDEVYLSAAPNGFDRQSIKVKNSGLGLGLTAKLNYTILKRISLTLSSSFWHVFEKGLYTEMPPLYANYYQYKPSRNMLVFQPKIGYLF